MPICPQCDNRPFSNREALLQHMKSSSAWHPFCAICDRRFSSQMAYDAIGLQHMADKHPPTFDCVVCNRSYHALFALEDHYRGSAAHPNCVRCGRGFEDSAACEEHHNTEHLEAIASRLPFDSKISTLSVEDTSATQLPDIVDLTAQANDQSFPSPTNMDLALINKSGISPSTSSQHIQELVMQGEQRVASPIDLPVDVSSPLTQVTPPFSPISPSLLPRPGTDIEQYWTSRQNISASRRVPLSTTSRTESTVSTSYWFSTGAQPSFRLRDGRSTLSPPMVLQAPQISVPTILPSPPNSAHRTDFDSRLYPGSARYAMRMQNDALGRRRPLGSESISQPSLLRYRGSNGAPDETRWSQFVRGGDRSQHFASGERASIPNETMTVQGGTNISEGSPQSSCGNLRHSPGSHNNEPDTRPTTASSTPCIAPITYTITPSSECPSPHSPEVVSPIGLGALPAISPFPITPIDLVDFEIPEARKPLPESPTGSRTTTPSVEHNSPRDHLLPSSLSSLLTEHLPVSTSPLSTSSTKSYTTSPQEPLNTNEYSSTIPPSPITPVALATIHSTSTASNPNPLHCRACLADTCDDITASMCGHIFCNRCITDAVIKTNRCPVCMTPTLLYCLFRLDLAA